MTYPKSTERQVVALLRQGETLKRTAQIAGVSPGYVKARKRRLKIEAQAITGVRPVEGLDGSPDSHWSKQTGGTGVAEGPVPPDDLKPVARDCLEDFGRFRARYFGRVSTPWQVEAGHRVKELLATDAEEYLVVNCPPGSGKTALFTHDIPAWLTCRDRTIRGLLGAYGERVAAAYTGRLRASLVRRTPSQAKTEPNTFEATARKNIMLDCCAVRITALLNCFQESVR